MARSLSLWESSDAQSPSPRLGPELSPWPVGERPGSPEFPPGAARSARCES